jgi:phage recombination protein Bet
MSDQAIVRYTTDSGVAIALSPQTVRDYLVSGDGDVSDQEVVMFLELCRAQRLNPFLREAYLIKFGRGPASIVTGKETFLKRAEKRESFDGFEAGITLLVGGQTERREGALLDPEREKLIGGWANVWRKDRAHPFFVEASFDEYAGRTRDGSLNRQWSRMPATMMRKVPLVQALREAFPNAFGGLLSPEEIGVDGDALPQAPAYAPAGAVTDGLVEMVGETALNKLRGLRLSLGVDAETYAGQLSAFGVERDDDLTAAQAEHLMGVYERRIAESEDPNGTVKDVSGPDLADEDIPF